MILCDRELCELSFENNLRNCCQSYGMSPFEKRRLYAVLCLKNVAFCRRLPYLLFCVHVP